MSKDNNDSDFSLEDSFNSIEPSEDNLENGNHRSNFNFIDTNSIDNRINNNLLKLTKRYNFE